MNVTATLDRIDGPIAVLEIGDQAVDWPLSALPAGAREGQQIVFQLQIQDTASIHQAGEERLDRLRARSSDDNDIDL